MQKLFKATKENGLVAVLALLVLWMNWMYPELVVELISEPVSIFLVWLVTAIVTVIVMAIYILAPFCLGCGFVYASYRGTSTVRLIIEMILLTIVISVLEYLGYSTMAQAGLTIPQREWAFWTAFSLWWPGIIVLGLMFISLFTENRS